MKTLLTFSALAALSGCATLSNASLAVRIHGDELRIKRLEGTMAHVEGLQKLRGKRLDEIESDVFELQQKEVARTKSEKARKKGKS